MSQRDSKWPLAVIGLLQLAVTWYKIRHAGEQAYYYSRTGTAKQCYFILSNLNFLCFGCPSAGIIIGLLSSMADLYHVTASCKRPISHAKFISI